MPQISTLFPLLVCFHSALSALTATNGSCPHIEVCKPFQEISLKNFSDSASVEALKLMTDEQLVAQLGHVEGLKPESYNLVFKFRNKTHYEGSAAIHVTVKKATNRVVINRARKVPEIDYKAIYIEEGCSEGRSGAIGCIEKVLELNDSFVLQLTKELHVNAKYVIHIPTFKSHAYNELTDSGSVGLASSGGDESGFWGLTTIFQMRYARTVFPCFDHPALKATFELCLQHPPGWTAGSNMPLSGSQKLKSEQLVESCFHKTPPISTYVFTIALMENYSFTSSPRDQNLTLELYSPIPKTDRLYWIPYSAKAAVKEMENLIGTAYPLSKLSFYVVFPAPFWGIENLGMIALEGAWMEEGVTGSKAALILNHEIVHQWIGDTVTISSWREICIQEGLTAFLEWKLSQDLQNVSMEGQAEEAASGFRIGYPSFLIQYNKTQDIADRCFGMPPIFFKTIYDFYGLEAFKKFLNKLVTQGHYGNLNVTAMDKILSDSVGDQKLHGYLESWFGQPGFATLFVSAKEREVQILQGEIEDYERVVVNDKSTRPIPLHIMTSNGQIMRATVPKRQNLVIPLETIGPNKNDWVLIDPDNAIPVRKFYELKAYQKFLCTRNSTDCDHKVLTEKRIKSIWSNFCKGVTLDVFPWGNDKTNFDAKGWAAMLADALKKKLLDPGTCRCCVNTEEENKKNKGCFFTWEQSCRKLHLNQLLGRNYTLPKGSPFWRPNGGDDA